MCYLEGNHIYLMHRAHALHWSCKLNGLRIHQGLLSSISQNGTLKVMLPCKQALFTCLSLIYLVLFVAMLSSVHFCIFFYARVSVCPLYPGLCDNETMVGTGLLCIFHSHRPPKQILLFQILGVVCVLMLLLHLGNHMSLLICHSFCHMLNTTWETKVSDSQVLEKTKILYSSKNYIISGLVYRVENFGCSKACLLIKPQD